MQSSSPGSLCGFRAGETRFVDAGQEVVENELMRTSSRPKQAVGVHVQETRSEIGYRSDQLAPPLGSGECNTYRSQAVAPSRERRECAFELGSVRGHGGERVLGILPLRA